MENDFNYGSYGYIAVLDFNTAEKFASIEPRVSVQYMQQAIEKILKHYLTLTYTGTSKEDVLHAHKLIFLASQSNLPALKPYRGTLALLSQYYFDGRYPGIDYMEPTLEDAEDLLKEVKQIFNIVLSAINNYQPSVSSINLPQTRMTKMSLNPSKKNL